MYKLVFFVPETECEKVKSAVLSTGAGKIGHYDQCSWQVLGEGQFRPLQGSSPSIGVHGEKELVREYRVELVCEDRLIADAVAALKRTHPYEEPAYDVTKLEPF